MARSRALGLRLASQSGSSQRHSVLWFPTNTEVCGNNNSRKASRYSSISSSRHQDRLGMYAITGTSS
ncbi:hypothetical protein D3C71_1791390 [compost metagenome]